jgi:hypothetical protein
MWGDGTVNLLGHMHKLRNVHRIQLGNFHSGKHSASQNAVLQAECYENEEAEMSELLEKVRLVDPLSCKTVLLASGKGGLDDLQLSEVFWLPPHSTTYRPSDSILIHNKQLLNGANGEIALALRLRNFFP